VSKNFTKWMRKAEAFIGEWAMILVFGSLNVDLVARVPVAGRAYREQRAGLGEDRDERGPAVLAPDRLLRLDPALVREHGIGHRSPRSDQ